VTEAPSATLKAGYKEPRLSRIVEEYVALGARYVAVLYAVEKKPIVRSRGNKYFERVVGYRERIRMLDWHAVDDEELARAWLRRRADALEKELGQAVEGLLLTIEEA
jgi:hypothetical protein